MKNYIIIIMTILLMSSCKVVDYANEVHEIEYIHDTIQVEKIKKDSVFIQDSVIIQMRNDTVFKDRWHKVYKDKIVYKDSIKTVVEYKDKIIEKEIIKKTPWYNNTWIYVSAILALLICLILKLR